MLALIAAVDCMILYLYNSRSFRPFDDFFTMKMDKIKVKKCFLNLDLKTFIEFYIDSNFFKFMNHYVQNFLYFACNEFMFFIVNF